jgi:ABC-type transporter Mla MlaB component
LRVHGKNNGTGLVYHLHDSSATFRLALSGDLIREAVPGVEQAWLTAMSVMGRKSFLIDVSRITRVDAAGHDLLMRWHEHSGQFVASSQQARVRAETILGHAVTVAEKAMHSFSWLPFGARIRWLLASVVLLFQTGIRD